MQLGDYLKKCRETLKRTQPDIAAEIEIEQSYLSKLESGKSVPSNDVFGKLVKVYQIDLPQLVENLSDEELIRLGEIKQIKSITTKKQQQQLSDTRRWLVTGLIMLMFGIGFLALSILPSRYSEEFTYRSEGVLKAEENLTEFDLVYQSTKELAGNPAAQKKRTELLVRLDQHDEVTAQFKGEGFVVNTLDGRRFYQLYTMHF